jgi:hypothetical protein
MATTTRGIYYPTSSDSIAPLESHFSVLADSVDGALANSQSGSTAEFTLDTTVGTATTIAITFTEEFPSIPNLIGTVTTAISGSAYSVSFYGASTTGSTVKVHRVFGTSNDGNLKVNWLAKVE